MRQCKILVRGTLTLFAVWLGLIAVRPAAGASDPLCDPHPNGRLYSDRPLAPCGNNVWLTYNDSDTAFVFVHGILSNSRSAWFHEDPNDRQRETYWPELLRTDSRFGNPSIFLGGYYTEILSGIYDIRQAANDLLDALSLSGLQGKRPALEKNNIVFIAHSTGGIVVRHMLSRVWNTHVFRDKAIGLVLVASPSIGSKDADRVSRVSRLLPALGIVAENRMADQLRLHDSFLTELDKDFRTIKQRQIFPFMTGTELIEARFVVPWLRQAQIVTAESAARYFDEGHPIPGSDHFTIAKPPSRDAPSHVKLLAFIEGSFKAQVLAASRNRPPARAILMDSYAKIYERHPNPGEMNSHVIQRALQRLPIDVSDIEPVYVNWSNDDKIAEKHPDLIIIHYSSLETGGIRGENATVRMKRFLEYVLWRTSKTQIIVYSRIVDDRSRVDVNSTVRQLVAPNLRDRVHGFPVYKHGAPNHTFNNERVADELRNLVARVARLPN